jgi:hypothetical protein
MTSAAGDGPSRRDVLRQTLFDFFSSHSSEVDQIQAALLLHNPPFLLAIVGIFLSFVILSNTVISEYVSPLAYLLLLWPLFCLARQFAWRHVRRIIVRFYIRIPQLGDDHPCRVRKPDELADVTLPVVVWVDRFVSWVRETLGNPNSIDTTVLILGIMLIGLVCQVVSGLVVLAVFGCTALALPALLTRTQVLELGMGAVKALAVRPEK